MIKHAALPFNRSVRLGLALAAAMTLAGCFGAGSSGLGEAPQGVDTARWKVDASDCMRRADRLAGEDMERSSGAASGSSSLSQDMARMDARKARDRYYRNCLASKGYKQS